MRYNVRLWASLPARAVFSVEADSASEAEEYAMENYHKAPWDGSDYTRPDGSQIESAEVIG